MIPAFPCLQCGEYHAMSAAAAEGRSMQPVQLCPKTGKPTTKVEVRRAGDMSHGHADSEPCGMHCPIGGADGTTHQTTIDDITLCSVAPFTDDEVAALREYFRLLAAKRAGETGYGEQDR